MTRARVVSGSRVPVRSVAASRNRACAIRVAVRAAINRGPCRSSRTRSRRRTGRRSLHHQLTCCQSAVTGAGSATREGPGSVLAEQTRSAHPRRPTGDACLGDALLHRHLIYRTLHRWARNRRWMHFLHDLLVYSFSLVSFALRHRRAARRENRRAEQQPGA